MELTLLWTIQLAPLAAFILIQLLPASFKKSAPAFGAIGALTAAIASLSLLLTSHDLPKEFVYPWLHVAAEKLWPTALVSDYSFVVGFLIDPLNLLMITLVTTISFFVQLFSIYYMSDDPSRPRYFAFLSLFSFSMTGLVLSNNLLQTFIFWELVGLSSYLLIGFWYEKQTAAAAARKAFVVNRLADLGFYLGIIILFILFGTVNFMDLNKEALQQAFSPVTLTWIGALIFMGVMGKSAQFPFHIWLPDAMEGPTPVSALIHSATMVAAGVFLLARAFGLFSASETTLLIVLIVGSLTALVGATLATIQRDIKRIMAYSTVSQLGLMVMAMGAGHSVAGMFHLSTHAYFKSLLFLTAGAFIHHFHTNDIWEIAEKGGKTDRLAMFALSVGLLSLCGVFPFAGFFSKDMILESLREHNLFFYGVAVFVSFLTVYYSFRLFFVLFFAKIGHHAHDSHHAAHHESALLKFCRAIPLLALLSISLFVGALGTPLFGSKILHFLGGHEGHLNFEILVTTTLLILGGASIAYFQFRNPEKALHKLESGKNALTTTLEKKFYMDDLYHFLLRKVALKIAAGFNWFDRTVINGLMVNRTSYSIKDLGSLLSKIQNGLLQDYLSFAVGAGVLVIFCMIYWK